MIQFVVTTPNTENVLEEWGEKNNMIIAMHSNDEKTLLLTVKETTVTERTLTSHQGGDVSGGENPAPTIKITSLNFSKTLVAEAKVDTRTMEKLDDLLRDENKNLKLAVCVSILTENDEEKHHCCCEVMLGQSQNLKMNGQLKNGVHSEDEGCDGKNDFEDNNDDCDFEENGFEGNNNNVGPSVPAAAANGPNNGVPAAAAQRRDNGVPAAADAGADRSDDSVPKPPTPASGSPIITNLPEEFEQTSSDEDPDGESGITVHIPVSEDDKTIDQTQGKENKSSNRRKNGDNSEVQDIAPEHVDGAKATNQFVTDPTEKKSSKKRNRTHEPENKLGGLNESCQKKLCTEGTHSGRETFGGRKDNRRSWNKKAGMSLDKKEGSKSSFDSSEVTAAGDESTKECRAPEPFEWTPPRSSEDLNSREHCQGTIVCKKMENFLDDLDKKGDININKARDCLERKLKEQVLPCPHMMMRFFTKWWNMEKKHGTRESQKNLQESAKSCVEEQRNKEGSKNDSNNKNKCVGHLEEEENQSKIGRHNPENLHAEEERKKEGSKNDSSNKNNSCCFQ